MADKEKLVTNTGEPTPFKDGEVKPDCPICGGKGFVECAGLKIADCTCRYK